MCAIAGIIAKEAEHYHEHVKRMVSALAYRGPDEKGIHFFKNCVLGHARLSIVDLSNTGRQPMLSSDKQIGITFNGEIYGYRELKKTLGEYPFRTASDTEVILALYQKYGETFASRLPGMFAFALWDEKEEELICARDRFGEKPFYYAFGKNGEFIFASEIKAILASGLVQPVLNKKALIHYLQHLYTHPKTTIYQNITSLPPAHFLTYKKGKLSVKRYWELPKTNESIAIEDAIVRFKELFHKAVRRQLVADVAVGAFLSGGVDSTAVVAVASQYQRKLKTFSFDFGDARSELPFARAAAKMYGTEHIELSDSNADIADLLVRMQEAYDEPFADSSNIPTYLMSKLAHKHVKVALTGDGGDELLGGYRDWYRPLIFMREAKETPALWRVLLMRFFAKTTAKHSHLTYYSSGLKLKYLHASLESAHERQNTYFTEKEIAMLGLHNTKHPMHRTSSSLNDIMNADVENYMAGDILVKIDRASMAHALELRAPFLDTDFASFCISLPERLKITKEEDKIILRRTFEEIMPRVVRQRGKQGFGAPVRQWLTRPSLRLLKEECLNDPQKKIFQLISFEGSRAFARKDNYQTWILLVLALWAEKNNFHTQ